MADFNIAVQKTLVNEGGFVDNPNDHGGRTKYGITQKDMPDVDIATITPEQATTYYAEHYWKMYYSQIESQDIADKVFDMGVLFGIRAAICSLQSIMPNVVIDGAFGPNTLTAVNLSDPVSLLIAYKSVLSQRTFNIAGNDPTQRQFLVGWGRRINS